MLETWRRSIERGSPRSVFHQISSFIEVSLITLIRAWPVLDLFTVVDCSCYLCYTRSPFTKGIQTRKSKCDGNKPSGVTLANQSPRENSYSDRD